IHPYDWFLTCHFVDDQVMPGTLMYECCLHTLRIYLLRMGWVAEMDQVVLEPVPGVASRLKCRGQVIASTKTAAYEVVIRELGFRPEPYAIVDALMFADGKPIVEITQMSVRYKGMRRERLKEIWQSRRSLLPLPSRDRAVERGEAEPSRRPHPSLPSSSSEVGTARPLFDYDRILAFAVGKPSVAFGERYRIFDEERVIARLPGPPYQFLDRITAIDAEPWQMTAGGVIEAQYDVPGDAWYFESNRSDRMPFSVLLEVALQP